jgi:hypothetical protein
MERRIVDATFTITGPSDTGGFVNALPMVHHRIFPSIEDPSARALDELVTMKSEDWEGSEVWRGDARIAFHDSPVEELTRLAPREMIGAYYRSVGVSWRRGSVLGPGKA